MLCGCRCGCVSWGVWALPTPFFGAAAGACRQSAKHHAGGGSRGLREEGQRRMRGEQDCGGAGESTCGTMRGSTVAVLHGKGGGQHRRCAPACPPPPCRCLTARCPRCPPGIAGGAEARPGGGGGERSLGGRCYRRPGLVSQVAPTPIKALHLGRRPPKFQRMC